MLVRLGLSTLAENLLPRPSDRTYIIHRNFTASLRSLLLVKVIIIILQY